MGGVVQWPCRMMWSCWFFVLIVGGFRFPVARRHLTEKWCPRQEKDIKDVNMLSDHAPFIAHDQGVCPLEPKIFI